MLHFFNYMWPLQRHAKKVLINDENILHLKKNHEQIEIPCMSRFNYLTPYSSSHLIILYGLNHLPHSIAHHFESPSSNGSWLGFLHLWLAYRWDGNTPFSTIHGKECTTFHNVFQNAFVFIAKNVGFHVSGRHMSLHLPSF